MSTILYHKGTLAVDSGFINQLGTDIRVFSNDKSLKKITVSKNKVLAVASTGTLLKTDQFQSIANFLECHLQTHKYLSLYDDTLRDVIKNIALENCSELCLVIIESIGRSVYVIELRDEENSIKFNINRISYDDYYAVGTGSLLALSAVHMGYSTIDAVKFAIRHDHVSSGPVQYVLMDSLQPSLDRDDDTEYLEMIKNSMEGNVR